MRFDRPLSWLEIILICALIGSWLMWAVLWVDGVAAHHSPADCRAYLSEVVKPRESGGDYTAANLSTSETHTDGRVGSFGGYQIAEFNWEEATEWMAEQGMRDWSGIRPDRAPPIVQDAVAVWLCERYGKCPWLFADERIRCYKKLS